MTQRPMRNRRKSINPVSSHRGSPEAPAGLTDEGVNDRVAVALRRSGDLARDRFGVDITPA